MVSSILPGFRIAFGWRAEEWSVECKSMIIVANLG